MEGRREGGRKAYTERLLFPSPLSSFYVRPSGCIRRLSSPLITRTNCVIVFPFIAFISSTVTDEVFSLVRFFLGLEAEWVIATRRLFKRWCCVWLGHHQRVINSKPTELFEREAKQNKTQLTTESRRQLLVVFLLLHGLFLRAVVTKQAGGNPFLNTCTQQSALKKKVVILLSSRMLAIIHSMCNN